MADVFSPERRSEIMSAIRSKNTRPEIIIRKKLFKLGFRYRIHTLLPGKPDIVLKALRVAIFVHGCFWHGHTCKLFRLPKTRPEFWLNKIDKNQNNDLKSFNKLIESGWRVAIIWECSIRGKKEEYIEKKVVAKLAKWINSNRKELHIMG